MTVFTMHIFSYYGKSFLVMSIYMNLIIQLTSIFLLLIANNYTTDAVYLTCIKQSIISEPAMVIPNTTISKYT
jgi:hypothetical protein